jgi:hypothetical protein
VENPKRGDFDWNSCPFWRLSFKPRVGALQPDRDMPPGLWEIRRPPPGQVAPESSQGKTRRANNIALIHPKRIGLRVHEAARPHSMAELQTLRLTFTMSRR